MRVSGFTLLEILIVIVIISIASSAALLAFGDFGNSRKVTMAAQRLSTYIKLLQQKAILESNTFGIRIENRGYIAYRYTRNGSIHKGSWQPISKNNLFRWQSFPNDTIIMLQDNLKQKVNEPNIIINSSGDMTEFKLDFGTLAQTKLITLIGKHNGELVLQ